MSYTNGRLYTETVAGQEVGISIGDLQNCFGTVVVATVGGTVVRRLSSDLGVIVAKKAGDTFLADYIEDGVVALLASIATARKVEDHERRIAELEKDNKRLREQLKIA